MNNLSSRCSRLEQAVRDFTCIFSQPVQDPDVARHSIIAGIHQLCVAMLEAELAGVATDEIASRVLPARELHGRSPFVKRLQTWPRGYPGDFETIEYVCSAEPRPTESTVEHYLEKHCLRDINAQQHRNKIDWQAKAILRTVLSKPDAKILSIACGGSRDLRSVQDFLANTALRIVLNDMDADALALSVASLPALDGRITPLQGDVFNSVRRIKQEAPFDLILAGGLFDYLSEKQIIWLVPKLYGFLAPGGRLCFTNVAVGNPDRIWLRYMASWQLTERSEPEVHLMIRTCGIRPEPIVSIERDNTGLTLLVVVDKPNLGEAHS